MAGRHAAPRRNASNPVQSSSVSHQPRSPAQSINDSHKRYGGPAHKSDGNFQAVGGRAAGPVTAALRIVQSQVSRPVYAAACLWPLVPAAFLIWPALHDRLVLVADGVLGFDATLCLVACLAVTPVITIAKARISRLRWWYGLWVFFLGIAALAIHLAYPPVTGMPVSDRVAGTAVNWTGLLIVVLLFPMAATSSAAAQKMLGPEWKRWQRSLMWIVWAAVGIHFALMHAWLILLAYAGSTLPAVLLRSGRVRRSIRKWREDRYSSGGWWFALAVLGTIAAAGILILAEEELIAIVNAVLPVGS